MAITLNNARQSAEVAYVDFTYSDLVNGADLPAVSLPPGAVILGGNIVTSVAFNSATSDAIDVGDALSQNRYLNDGNFRPVGTVQLVPTGFLHSGGDVTVRWVGTGAAPTAGKARLTIWYYTNGRQESCFE